MATIQNRTARNCTGSHRVSYHEDGKRRWTPILASIEGAKKIIETQGHEIALEILQAQHESQTMTLRDWFPKHLAIRAIEVTDGTIVEYEREAERTWMPTLGDLPLDAITRQHVIEWAGQYM
jgi:hypothetical protein